MPQTLKFEHWSLIKMETNQGMYSSVDFNSFVETSIKFT